jgi:hypothetical protein
MKKVIDGKLYNTNTAQLVHSYGRGSAWQEDKETLYRSQKGAWFLYGEGGPKSQYSEPEPGGWSTGTLIPFTDGEALRWLEQHASADVALEHFGSKVEEA